MRGEGEAVSLLGGDTLTGSDTAAAGAADAAAREPIVTGVDRAPSADPASVEGDTTTGTGTGTGEGT